MGAQIFGAAWSVITFLAVPIMVVQNTNIFKGLSRSNKLMEKTWGKHHPAFSLGYFFVLLNVPTLVYAVVLYFQPGESHFLMELLGAMYFLLTMVMIQASRSVQVLMVALYEYAETGNAPALRRGLPEGGFCALGSERCSRGGFRNAGAAEGLSALDAHPARRETQLRRA